MGLCLRTQDKYPGLPKMRANELGRRGQRWEWRDSAVL
jgi:hypothetical protein